MNVLKALELLPQIATSPLAILAYIVVISVWVIYLVIRHKGNVFLDALARIPDSEKSKFVTQSGYKINILAQVSNKDRLKIMYPFTA